MRPAIRLAGPLRTSNLHANLSSYVMGRRGAEPGRSPDALSPARRSVGAVVGVLILLLAAAIPARCATRTGKLKSVRQELAETRRELERYQDLERSLNAEINAIDVREAEDRLQAKKLRDSLGKVEEKRKDLEKRLGSLNTAAGFWRETLIDEMGRYAVYRSRGSQDEGLAGVREGTFRRQALLAKGLWLMRLHGLKRQTLPAFERSALLKEGLEGREREALREAERRRRAQAGKKAALAKAHERTAWAKKQIKELERTAKELSTLLGRIRREGGKPAVRLSIPPNSLSWPAAGRLISDFGKHIDAELGTEIRRHGIELEVAEEAPVRAVAGGRVIFSGPFRSYGRVVIIDHESFFTVYGRLGRILREKGSSVLSTEPIAQAGRGEGMGGRLYFEIRSGDRAVNPLLWLKKRRLR